MAALRYASFGLVLLLFGCASLNPKPIEVDMPSAQKHFIVQVDGEPQVSGEPRPLIAAGSRRDAHDPR
jgi:hypothetical protein